MNNLSVFDYNGKTITRREDGFVNLTQMCQANGKRLDHWKALKATDAYTQELQANYPESQVVQSEEGAGGGTWGHPSLAINLARWISPAFAVWCDSHVFKLMSTGSTDINNTPKLPRTYAEALLEAGRLAMENERLEEEKALLEQENHQLSEALDELFDYSSIVRIAKFNKVHESNFSWRPLKALSMKMGKEVKKVPDARYEFKNLYSHDVWRVAYPDVRLPETTTLVIAK